MLRGHFRKGWRSGCVPASSPALGDEVVLFDTWRQRKLTRGTRAADSCEVPCLAAVVANLVALPTVCFGVSFNAAAGAEVLVGSASTAFTSAAVVSFAAFALAFLLAFAAALRSCGGRLEQQELLRHDPAAKWQ